MDIFEIIKTGIFNKIMNFLSETEVDQSTTIHSGITPLLYSLLYCDDVEVIKLLLDKGANLDDKDHYENSVLHIVVRSGNIKVAKLLIENGINVDSENIDGETPLQYACFWSDFEMVKLLIDNGADVNHSNNIDNKKVFDYASEYSSFEIINYLINNNVELKDDIYINRDLVDISSVSVNKLKKVNEIKSVFYMVENSLRYEEYEYAIEDVEKVLQFYPDIFELHMLCGHLLLQDKRFAEALTIYNIAFEEFPENRDLLLYKIYTLIQLDNFIEAEKLINDLVVSFPESLRGLGLNRWLNDILECKFENISFNAVECTFDNYAIMKLYNSVMKTLSNQYCRSPHNPVEQSLERIDDLEYDEKYNEAEDILKELLVKDIDNYEIHCKLGHIYDCKSNNDYAEEFFNNGIIINPNRADAYELLGDFFYYEGQYLKSIKPYEKAIKITGLDFSSIYKTLLYSYFFIGEYNKSLELAFEAIKFKDDVSDMNIHIGDIYLLQGKEDLAITHYKTAISLEDEIYLEEVIESDDLLKSYLVNRNFSNTKELYSLIYKVHGDSWTDVLREETHK